MHVTIFTSPNTVIRVMNLPLWTIVINRPLLAYMYFVKRRRERDPEIIRNRPGHGHGDTDVGRFDRLPPTFGQKYKILNNKVKDIQAVSVPPAASADFTDFGYPLHRADFYPVCFYRPIRPTVHIFSKRNSQARDSLNSEQIIN